MKKIISVMLLVTSIIRADEPDIVIGAGDAAQAHPCASMNIYGGILAPQSEYLKNLMALVQLNIERSQQFKLDIVACALPKYTKDITDLFERGYPLLLFIDELKEKGRVEWRLYDATRTEMVKGKKQELAGETIAQNAHALCDTLWPELLGGQRAPFLTRIAYIKRGKNKLGKRISYLCTSDWLGKDERAVLTSTRILVAPSWFTHVHDGHQEQQLFFSEFTPSNVRCMKVVGNSNKVPVFDFDGTCVGISCSPDGTTAVYCRSGALWRYTYDATLKKGLHERVVKRGQPCTHPTLLTCGDVVFCSGGSLYRWDKATKSAHALVREGYCVAPDVYEKDMKIVYSKRIKGVMQLMVGDLATGNHEQITSDSGDKIDPKWSPCGLYIAFCREQGRESRICLIHRSTRASYCITSASDHCSYPAWSSYDRMW